MTAQRDFNLLVAGAVYASNSINTFYDDPITAMYGCDDECAPLVLELQYKKLQNLIELQDSFPTYGHFAASFIERTSKGALRKFEERTQNILQEAWQ